MLFSVLGGLPLFESKMRPPMHGNKSSGQKPKEAPPGATWLSTLQVVNLGSLLSNIDVYHVAFSQG
jgi:hypothetical protein